MVNFYSRHFSEAEDMLLYIEDNHLWGANFVEVEGMVLTCHRGWDFARAAIVIDEHRNLFDLLVTKKRLNPKR